MFIIYVYYPLLNLVITIKKVFTYNVIVQEYIADID